MDYRRLFRFRDRHGADLRRELDDEIRTHIELRTQELEREGLDPGEARSEAERRFGDLDAAREALYASAQQREQKLSRRRGFEELARDVRMAVRRLVRAPGYSSVSIGILGIGIALTTSMFAVVDHVLLRALPFEDSEFIYALQSVGEDGTPFPEISMGNWFDWRERIGGLEATGLYRPERVPVVLGAEAFRVDAVLVSGEFFDVLRPAMTAGRVFTSEEGQAGRRFVTVSNTFATRHFGDAASALGRPLTVRGGEYEIVGVIDDVYTFPERSEIWIPRVARPEVGRMRNNVNHQAIARIDPEVGVGQVRAQATATAIGIMESDPEGIYSHDVGVIPLQEVLVADARRTLVVLMIAVGGVLLAACANLAGLGLARIRRRAPEIALRMALGSGRWRVARELIAEYVVLALAGGATGLLLALAAERVLFDRLGGFLPRAGLVELDYRIGLFALGVSLLAGLLAGVLPAVRATGARMGSGVGRGRVSGGRGLPGGVLVSAEVALALVLLVGGGLMLRSLQSVTGRDLGYDPTGVVTAEIDLSTSEYQDSERVVEYWHTLLESLEELPGVAAAGAGNWIPTGGGGTSFLEFPENPEPDYGGGYRVVSEHYFDALGIGILEGRAFDDRDGPGTERVTLVNRALAARAWPGESAIGRRVRPTSMEEWMYDGNPPWLTVIGVVEDVRHFGYESDVRPELFVRFDQVPAWATAMTAVVRPRASDANGVATLVLEQAQALDPALAVEMGDLDLRVQGLLEERVVAMRILMGFAASALLLMCLGIYGLVSYAASMRTREMAIRAALGARRNGLLRLMLSSAARVIVAGGVVGTAAAYLLSGLLGSLLVDVPPTDPVTYVAAGGLLGAVALLAAFMPSLRAAKMDPMEAFNSG